MSITETIPSVSQYGGTIPDKATQSKTDFANNVQPYLNYINATFVVENSAMVASVNTWSTEANLLLNEVNTSRDTAVTKASEASTSESNASTSESNASTSAANALTSENNASTSEANALTSENNASNSETNAATSETNASNSEANASTSESNAATSESNAGTSESNALNSQIEAASSASIAVGAVNYKGDWVANYNTTGYSLGMSISYTDGYNYISKIDNNLIEPTTLTNTTEWDWIESIDPTSVYTKAEVDTNFETKDSTILKDADIGVKVLAPDGDATNLINVPTDTSKQDTLVSGTNIKSINGVSILGNGNLDSKVDLNIQIKPTQAQLMAYSM